MDPELELLFARSGGILRRRDHPWAVARLDRLLAAGKIVSPLPGVLAIEAVVTAEQRIMAGLLWAGPDAIVGGLAAAWLSFWPEVRLGPVQLFRPTRAMRPRPGWAATDRRVPPELIWQRGQIRYTAPALTAIDLATGSGGGDIIDRVLRTRSATMADLRRALRLTSGRRGNRARATLVEDSRDEPWSEAERELHRLFRRAGITGWRTNVRIDGADWRCYADICFATERVIVEVDGWEIHGARTAFETDRVRRNRLVLAGYTVLNFTWRQIVDQPQWVLECVRQALGR